MLNCFGLCFGKNDDVNSETRKLLTIGAPKEAALLVQNDKVEITPTEQPIPKKIKQEPRVIKIKDKFIEKENDTTYDSADETKDVTEYPGSTMTGALSDDEKDVQSEYKTPTERKPFPKPVNKIIDKLIPRRDEVKVDETKSESSHGKTSSDVGAHVEDNQLVKESENTFPEGTVSEINDPFTISTAEKELDQLDNDTHEIQHLMQQSPKSEPIPKEEVEEVKPMFHRTATLDNIRAEFLDSPLITMENVDRKHLLDSPIAIKNHEAEIKKIPEHMKINETSTIVDRDRFETKSDSPSSSPLREKGDDSKIRIDGKLAKLKEVETPVWLGESPSNVVKKTDVFIHKEADKEAELLQEETTILVNDSPVSILENDSVVKKEEKGAEFQDIFQEVVQEKLESGSVVISRPETPTHGSPVNQPLTKVDEEQ
jgi:hypothetical protein